MITLALYQLCTSGLLGVPEGLPDRLRGGLLGGLAGLLLPLLFLWPGSGALFVKDAQKAATFVETGLLPGECMLPTAAPLLSALAALLYNYLCYAIHRKALHNVHVCAGQHDGSQAPSEGMVWVHISSSASSQKGHPGAEEPLLGTCQVSNPLPSTFMIAFYAFSLCEAPGVFVTLG